MDGQALVEHPLDGGVDFASMGGAVVQYALALTAGEMAQGPCLQINVSGYRDTINAPASPAFLSNGETRAQCL